MAGMWAFTSRRRSWILEVSVHREEKALVSLPSEACGPGAALTHPGLGRAQQAWQEHGGLERTCSSKVIQLNLKRLLFNSPKG